VIVEEKAAQEKAAQRGKRWGKGAGGKGVRYLFSSGTMEKEKVRKRCQVPFFFGNDAVECRHGQSPAS